MPTLPQKFRTFVCAITSGRDKKLQAARDAVCNKCDQFAEHPVKNIWGKWRMAGHCKACGCGAKSIADIHRGKHAWRKIACPLLKFPGDAEGKGLTLRDANMLFGARERLEYNMAVVQNLIDKGKPMDAATQAQVFGQPQAPSAPQRSAEGKARGGAVAARSQATPQLVPTDKFDQVFLPGNKGSAAQTQRRVQRQPAAALNSPQAPHAENLLGAGV